jgi:AraC family transcriptional regulator
MLGLMKSTASRTRDINGHAIVASSYPLAWLGLNVERRFETSAGVTDVPQGVTEYGMFLFRGEGDATTSVDGSGQRAGFSPGTYCLFPPCAPLRWTRFTPARLDLISIDTRLLSQGAAECGLSLSSMSPVLSPRFDAVIAGLVDALVGIMVRPDVGPARLEVEQIQHTLIHHLLRVNEGARPETAGRRDRRLLRTLDHMQAHLASEITLDQLASIACMSKYHYLRSFHAAFGDTPARWLTSARLDQAARALKNPRDHRTVTLMAMDAGFSCAASFERAFRKRFNVAPGRYRGASRR